MCVHVCISAVQCVCVWVKRKGNFVCVCVCAPECLSVCLWWVYVMEEEEEEEEDLIVPISPAVPPFICTSEAHQVHFFMPPPKPNPLHTHTHFSQPLHLTESRSAAATSKAH